MTVLNANIREDFHTKVWTFIERLDIFETYSAMSFLRSYMKDWWLEIATYCYKINFFFWFPVLALILARPKTIISNVKFALKICSKLKNKVSSQIIQFLKPILNKTCIYHIFTQLTQFSEKHELLFYFLNPKI